MTQDRRAAGLPWIVMGSGKRGRDVAESIRKAGGSVLAFSDMDPKTPCMPDGTPVLRHCDVPSIVDPAFARAALGIHNLRFDPAGWKAFSKPFAQAHDTFSLARMLPGTPAAQGLYWLCPKEEWNPPMASIQSALSLLSDQKSRDVLAARIAASANGDPSLLPPPEGVESQYFPEGLPIPKNLSMVDCGACVGDAAESAISSGRTFDSLLSFEPDPSCAALLKERAPAFGVPEGSSFLIQAAVSDSEGSVRFASGQGAASSMSQSGDIVVETLTVDSVVERLGFRPNMIKMDVEGHEAAALAGCRKTVRRFEPVLAVCAYHLPYDILDLPSTVASMYPAPVRIFLRQHGHCGFDTVLYAIPERLFS